MSTTRQEMERDLSKELTTAQDELEPGMLQPSAPELEKLPNNPQPKNKESHFYMFGRALVCIFACHDEKQSKVRPE